MRGRRDEEKGVARKENNDGNKELERRGARSSEGAILRAGKPVNSSFGKGEIQQIVFDGGDCIGHAKKMRYLN